MQRAASSRLTRQPAEDQTLEGRGMGAGAFKGSSNRWQLATRSDASQAGIGRPYGAFGIYSVVMVPESRFVTEMAYMRFLGLSL